MILPDTARFQSLQRLALGSFTLLLLLMTVGLGVAIKQGLVFETDLQALLPQSDDSQLAQRAGQRLFDYGGDKILLVIASARRNDALAAADRTQQMLEQSPLFQVDSLASRSEHITAQLNQLLPYRFHLLSSRQRQALDRGEAAQLAQQALRDLYTPQGWGRSASLQQDPLNLLQGLQTSLQTAPPQAELAGEHLLLHSVERPDWSYVMLAARSRDSALDLDAQQAVAAAIDAIEQALQSEYRDVRLLRSGIVFHAAAAARQARAEIILIGSGSAAGIILLFLVTFASLRPLLLSLASLLFGSLCALTLCHYLFGTIHLLTLVFGASLIGVAIDYSLHYFTRVHGAGNSASGQASLRAIFPGILLGLVTSVIGYGSLAQAPLPGLRQIATFSVAGLASAWLFVVAVYPRTASPAPRRYPLPILRLARAPWRLWQGLSGQQVTAVLAGLAVASTAVCWWGLTSADDLRSLYQPSEQLLEQERQIQGLAGNYSANQFFLVSAVDAQTLLQREEQLQAGLARLQTDGVIEQWHGVSRYLPSIERQQRNYQRLQSVYGEDGIAWALMTQLGVDEADQRALRQAYVDAKQHYLLPREWLAGASGELQMLWLGGHGGPTASMVTLQGVGGARDLQQLEAAAAHIDGVQFNDRVARISTLLEDQRHSASAMLAVAYASVMGLLLLRYRQPRSLLLVLAPLLSTTTVLAMLALAAIPLSLFHVFALFLVLGLGMDYGIFAREAGADDSDCRLAIMLSALTSGLSFGLLALSSTPMVQAFGLTVLLGSLLNLLLVPLVTRLAARPGL